MAAGSSAKGLEAAIKAIDDKEQEVEKAAMDVAKAFTDLSSQVKLIWLNKYISGVWNDIGTKHIQDAIEALQSLKREADGTITKSSEISEG